MTQKNNFLLILKQNPGIDYNELLNRMTPEYGSVNSARAALSRTLKDLAAIGVVQRQANKIFVTDKGLVEINSEMKNKLLTRLNETMASKNPVDDIETIVKMLQTLIERSKADNDLLKAAKTSSNFYISDLLGLKEKTEKRSQQLKYLCEVLVHQIASMQELNFNDFKKIPLTGETIPKIFEIIEKQELQQIHFECLNPSFAGQVKESMQAKTEQNNLMIEKKQALQLLELAEKFPPTEKNLVKIFLPTMQIKIENQQAYLIAPFAQLQQTETNTTEQQAKQG